MSSIVVIAKECVPGNVKTRLHPPLSLEGAAALAAISLGQTLDAVRRVHGVRRILFFDGTPDPRCTADFTVLHQPRGSLDERLGWLFDHVRERMLVIGMDTPQVDPHVLAATLADDRGFDAWIGPASDGGFWALGMDVPRGHLIRGVPMSRADTGARQRALLAAAGLRIADLPELTDVDTIESAREVAALVPASPFGRALEALDPAAVPA